MIAKTLSNLFWRVALVGVILLSGYVYYLKFPDFREVVDKKLPIVKELNGKLLARWNHGDTPAPAVPASAAAPEATPQLAAVATLSPAVAVATPAAKVVTQPASDTVDLAQLSQSRTEWPKVVSLKKMVEFPAVVDGKVVGTVKAPAGAEANLVMVQVDKVGVEYEGGGAMVDVADTDLIERVRANRHAGLK